MHTPATPVRCTEDGCGVWSHERKATVPSELEPNRPPDLQPEAAPRSLKGLWCVPDKYNDFIEANRIEDSRERLKTLRKLVSKRRCQAKSRLDWESTEAPGGPESSATNSRCDLGKPFPTQGLSFSISTGGGAVRG